MFEWQCLQSRSECHLSIAAVPAFYDANETNVLALTLTLAPAILTSSTIKQCPENAAKYSWREDGKEMFGVLFILWDNIARLCPRIMEHNFPLYQNYRLKMMTACVILKWKKLCLMLELNTFSAVIIKLKTSRTTPIYQESALNQNYRRYNTDRELRTYLQKNNAVKVVQQPQTDFSGW